MNQMDEMIEIPMDNGEAFELDRALGSLTSKLNFMVFEEFIANCNQIKDKESKREALFVERDDLEEELFFSYNEIDYLASLYKSKTSSSCSDYIDLIDGHLVVKKNVKSEQRFLPNTVVGDGVLATAIVDKILFSLTISNVANRLSCCGFKVQDTQLGRWALNVAEVLTPLSDLILEEILKTEAICLEERCANAEDLDQLNCYYPTLCWSIHGPEDKNKAVYYYYAMSDDRSSLFKSILKDYQGVVQVDGEFPDFDEDVSFVCGKCFQRFTYLIAEIFQRGNYNSKDMVYVTFKRISRYVDALIQIDVEWQQRYKNNEVTKEEFLKGRKEESLLFFDKLDSWCEGRLDLHSSNSKVTNIINYYLSNKKYLMVYLDHYNLTPSFSKLDDEIDYLEDCKSTNLVCLNEESTKSLVVLESIIKTAILNELDPYDYMQYLLHMVSTSDVDFASLLPWNLEAGTVKKYDIYSEE